MRKLLVLTFLWAVCQFRSSAYAERALFYPVTFVVTAPEVSSGDTLFVALNQLDWQTDAAPMERRADGRWTRTFRFQDRSFLEYKITRGSWQTQAVAADGAIPPKGTCTVVRDTTIVMHVAAWDDQVRGKEGRYTGRIEHHPAIVGEGLLPRDVFVWLPPSYEDQPTRRYPVLYMHDGQNVFSPYHTLVGEEWAADEIAAQLIEENRIEETIIVGISSTEQRWTEYMDGSMGRAYMALVVNTIKPLIDRTYRTLSLPEHTATMGASMGGLIAYLLVWHYPDVFSQAGCLSPSFGDLNLKHMDRIYQGFERRTRLYLDNGEHGLEAELQPGCDMMLDHLQKEREFVLGENLEWFFHEGAWHTERAWSERLWRPLTFMFGTDGER